MGFHIIALDPLLEPASGVLTDTRYLNDVKLAVFMILGFNIRYVL